MLTTEERERLAYIEGHHNHAVVAALLDAEQNVTDTEDLECELGELQDELNATKLELGEANYKIREAKEALA
jgi:predicted  nucleic acid-binding Zn-ribbon protein